MITGPRTALATRLFAARLVAARLIAARLVAAHLFADRLFADRRGIAAVEMALLSTFLLLPLMGGIVGIGQGLAMQNKLDRALHAGLMYAWGVPTATTSAIQGAVQNGYGDTTPTVSSSQACYCINPTDTRANGTAVSCTGSCTSPQVRGTWTTISASVSFTPLMAVGPTGWNQAGGASGAVTIASTATVRVQ